jgi:dihydroxyacetone kinase DhaKLM complex PTS-EIIA-like component DhaM
MSKSVLNIAALRIAGTSMKRLGSATSWISDVLDQRSSSAMILLYFGSALIKRNEDIIILFYFVQRKENEALPRID